MGVAVDRGSIDDTLYAGAGASNLRADGRTRAQGADGPGERPLRERRRCGQPHAKDTKLQAMSHPII